MKDTIKNGVGRAPAQGSKGMVAMEALCGALGWTIDHRQEGMIGLDFKDPVLSNRTIWVFGGDTVMIANTFATPTLLPHQVGRKLLGQLLQRNNKLAIGGWSALEEDGRTTFAVRQFFFATSIQPYEFRVICDELLTEVREFDQKMKAAGAF